MNWTFSCLFAALLISGMSVRAAEMPWDDLPEGNGRTQVYAICAACHSFDIVATQGLSRDEWDETLVWMTEKQGMAELSPELRLLVLDYLAAAYPRQSDNTSPVPVGTTLESLPAYEGRNEAFSFCSTCHSMRLVAQQRMDREEWAETLDWMTEEQGMVELPGEVRERVLNYLFRAFPAERESASR